MPRAPRKGRPPMTSPAPMPGRQAQVGHDVGAAAGAEGRLAQRADVGVVVEVDRQPEALLHLGGGVERRPSRAGSAASARGRSRGRSGRAGPCPRRARGRARRRPRRAARSTSAAAVSRASSAARVDVELREGTRPGSCRRGRRRRRAVSVAEVDADHGAGRAVEREEHRRAPALRGRAATPSAARSTTRPAAWRSPTRLETVERLRPVWRAISARLIAPRGAARRRRAGGCARAATPATRSAGDPRARPSPIRRRFAVKRAR